MDQPPRTAPVITKTPEPETLQSAHRSQQSPKDPLYARTRERLRELLLSPEAQKYGLRLPRKTLVPQSRF